MNNCIKCGCEDANPSLPPCPSPEACPDSQPCAEAFDAQCVKFTLPNIICNETIVVAQDDSISDALIGIVSYFCNHGSDGIQSVTGLNTNNADPQNPVVRISVDGTTITGLGTPASPIIALVSKGNVSITRSLISYELSVTLTNITGPVTYEWSFADADPGLLFTSATTIPTVTLIRNSNITEYQPFVINVTGTGIISINKYSALVKVRVTDSNGFIYTDYYNYSIDISLYE